jgi:hypothetical protein
MSQLSFVAVTSLADATPPSVGEKRQRVPAGQEKAN